MGNQELRHHGVKGMKWGVRKKIVRKRDVKQAKDEMKAARNTTEYKAAKIRYKVAKKSYKQVVKEYAKEIEAGQSFVYRMFANVTGISRVLAKAYVNSESTHDDYD